MDCLEGMRIIPDKSVDLIVTDPPYEFETRGAGFHKKRDYYDEIADNGLSKGITIAFLIVFILTSTRICLLVVRFLNVLNVDESKKTMIYERAHTEIQRKQ